MPKKAKPAPIIDPTWEFPEELFVTLYEDGDTEWPNAHEDLMGIDVVSTKDNRVAVYKLVREGSIKVRPANVTFTLNKD